VLRNEKKDEISLWRKSYGKNFRVYFFNTFVRHINIQGVSKRPVQNPMTYS